MNSIEKPLAVITGASRGIGAGIAKKLAESGFRVVINFSQNETQAQNVAQEIQKNGHEAFTLKFDVSNSQEVEEAFEKIVKTWGTLAVLINNAGITRDSLLLRMKDEDLEAILNTNLKGAIFCSRAASKWMIKGRIETGSIIQISSVIGEMGNPGQSSYAAAKAGLIGFSKSVAKELASRKIRVNVITPGFITTEMTQSLTDTQKEAILRNIPLGYLGSVQDVAELTAFLASPVSRYITGQVIGVNGGLYM